MDTTITKVEWMGKEATTNDNDAIVADMHARAGDAELILRATQGQSAVMMVVCYSGAAATAGAADSSTPVGASSPSLLWSSASGSNTCASGSLSVASPSHLAREVPRLCLVETSCLQKMLCFCEKLTLLHLVPIDEAPASGSMLRAVCVLCCCVHEREQQLSEHRCAGVQIDMFEVGLDCQEELGEVFGRLLTDRVLEGAHVRPLQRLSVSREVPLDVAQKDVRPGVAQDPALRNVLCWTIQNQEPRYQLGVTKACVHVRVNRVDHVQESVLRDPVRRRVGHELARKEWSMRVHSDGRSVFLEPSVQLSRQGSMCDPARFRSERTCGRRAAARGCALWQCQPISACGGCKSPRASMIAAGCEETASSKVWWARIRCRAHAAHGGRRAAKWGR